jgi:hypothetical protein
MSTKTQTVTVVGTDGKDYEVTLTAEGSITIDSLKPLDVPPPDTNTAGLITNFNPVNGGGFQVGGIECFNNNANKSWSIKQLDDYTLRFEVRQGDQYSSTGYTDPPNANRSEIAFYHGDFRPAGKELEVSEIITVQPGPISTAGWMDFCQLHAESDNPSSPFYIELEPDTEKLRVIAQSPADGWILVYLAPKPIVRGKPMNLIYRVKMSPNDNNGYIRVWLDGEQIVDWSGRCGAASGGYYWKLGAYRENVSETITVDHSHIAIKG